MSGGVAYIYDPDDNLERRLNRELVDLEALDDDDVATVEELIRRHISLTGSPLATRLGAQMVSTIRDMKKVMPRDYRKVIEATKRAIEAGENVDQAVMAVAHG
jgi:glutamate synthase (NADPH/NADH) large chain